MEISYIWTFPQPNISSVVKFPEIWHLFEISMVMGFPRITVDFHNQGQLACSEISHTTQKLDICMMIFLKSRTHGMQWNLLYYSKIWHLDDISLGWGRALKTGFPHMCTWALNIKKGLHFTMSIAICSHCPYFLYHKLL